MTYGSALRVDTHRCMSSGFLAEQLMLDVDEQRCRHPANPELGHLA